MKYTPEEVAKLLADRPQQSHYIVGEVASLFGCHRREVRILEFPATGTVGVFVRDRWVDHEEFGMFYDNADLGSGRLGLQE